MRKIHRYLKAYLVKTETVELPIIKSGTSRFFNSTREHAPGCVTFQHVTIFKPERFKFNCTLQSSKVPCNQNCFMIPWGFTSLLNDRIRGEQIPVRNSSQQSDKTSGISRRKKDLQYFFLNHSRKWILHSLYYRSDCKGGRSVCVYVKKLISRDFLSAPLRKIMSIWTREKQGSEGKLPWLQIPSTRNVQKKAFKNSLG